MNLTSATLKDLAYFAKVSGRHATLSGETCATIAAHIDAADDELAALRARVAEAYSLLQETQEYCMDLGLVVRIQKWCSANKEGSR